MLDGLMLIAKRIDNSQHEPSTSLVYGKHQTLQVDREMVLLFNGDLQQYAVSYTTGMVGPWFLGK